MEIFASRLRFVSGIKVGVLMATVGSPLPAGTCGGSLGFSPADSPVVGAFRERGCPVRQHNEPLGRKGKHVVLFKYNVVFSFFRVGTLVGCFFWLNMLNAKGRPRPFFGGFPI